jgi:deoxyribonuclease-4
VFVGAGLLSTGSAAGLGYAREVGAEAVQLFVSNPRGWAPAAGSPVRDEAFRTACAKARIRVFVHSAYLVNFGSPSAVTRSRSAESVRAALARGRRLGALGVVVHAGSAVAGGRDAALALLRQSFLPLLDELTDDDPMVLVEPTAGGGQPLAASVDQLASYFTALDDHPRLGVCLDTCHAFAAGHDLAAPGGVRTTLSALVKAVGRGRLRLVHANDSKDPVGSGRDRHASIGAGRIGLDPFAELFRHPATRDVPVIVETPGKAADHARDIALLKSLRDR